MTFEDVTDLDEYQSQANGFINARTNNTQLEMLNNAALGLSGESGEFADLVKKIIFHEHPFTEIEAQKLAKELGDVLWYVAQGAAALKTSLSTIATTNIIKLTERHGDVKFNKEASIAKEAAKECRFDALKEPLNEAINTRIGGFAGFTLREKKR